MKIRKEIRDRIEDIENAKADLNDRGNLGKEQFDEFNFKINELKWVLEMKNEN